VRECGSEGVMSDHCCSRKTGGRGESGTAEQVHEESYRSRRSTDVWIKRPAPTAVELSSGMGVIGLSLGVTKMTVFALLGPRGHPITLTHTHSLTHSAISLCSVSAQRLP
jgi:hypothetical protein